MMDEFLRIGLLNKREIEVSIATARSGIETHLFKLEKIVQKNTKAYNIRVREIIAEEYTKCVLKAAGINNNRSQGFSKFILKLDIFSSSCYASLDVNIHSIKSKATKAAAM